MRIRIRMMMMMTMMILLVWFASCAVIEQDLEG